MSVLIRGMEMPFTCLTCDFHKCAGGVGDFCSLTKSRQFRFKNRPKDCPLIELPPHGRLIDADALMNHEVLLPMYGGNMPIVYSSYIRNALTIIEAEEEGET